MKKASFLGWSLGGVVALEVCKGLQKNVLIKSLSLVDSIFRYDKYPKIKEDHNNINYRYAIDIEKDVKVDFHINLFKCDSLDYNRPTFDIFNYYKNIYDNHLSDLIDTNDINIFNLKESDHYNWVKNQDHIDLILSEII